MATAKGLFALNEPVIGVRGVHLDLKGTPPTPERLVRLLDVFAAARYNAVLVEWEDSFPWTVDARFRSETAYSPETIKRFARRAADLGIEVIPLVQCLGHMETPLSRPGYESLREVPGQEDVLNPLALGARQLVERMVEDVLRLLPGVKHFHLGGDEAWSFGTHPDTKAFIAKHGKGALYLKHIEPILDRLNRRGVRPILWHDMMREWDGGALRRLARKADLLVWGYSGHPDTTTHHFSSKVIERFVEHKITLWGGTAYKGADGSDSDLPNPASREANALAWAEVAQRYGFVGVIATAWSRYATNIQQCEPIDAALDSAFNVGVVLHDGKPPAGGLAACVKALDRIGEGKTFRRAQSALARLTQARNGFWWHLRLVRGLVVTVSQDPRRRPCAQLVKYLRGMRQHVADADTAAAAVRLALAGLMDAVWIERYLAERVEPLHEEFAALEPRVRQLTPETYALLMAAE